MHSRPADRSLRNVTARVVESPRHNPITGFFCKALPNCPDFTGIRTRNENCEYGLVEISRERNSRKFDERQTYLAGLRATATTAEHPLRSGGSQRVVRSD